MIKGSFTYKNKTYKYKFSIRKESPMEFGDYYDVKIKYKPKGKLLNHSIYMISFPEGYSDCYEYYNELYKNGTLSAAIEKTIINDIEHEEMVKLFN